MRKLKVKFLSHQTQNTHYKEFDGDLELWMSRRLKQLFDGDTGRVYTVLEVHDLGYTDDQKLQMLYEQEMQQYNSEQDYQF